MHLENLNFYAWVSYVIIGSPPEPQNDADVTRGAAAPDNSNRYFRSPVDIGGAEGDIFVFAVWRRNRFGAGCCGLVKEGKADV